MKKLSVFLYSSILGKKVYDEFDDYIGFLRDIYVTCQEGYPRIIGYRIKRETGIYDYEFNDIAFYQKENGSVFIKARAPKEILPRNYSYRLSKHLLDRKIVDINGKKVVDVKDLRIAELAGDYRVIAVETGALAWLRRKGLEKIGKVFFKLIGKDTRDVVIMWDDVESLEMVDNSLQLSVPYKKLQTLHPADLADIIEELDDGMRSKIFESLDEDLAADTLEEIEPEVQESILKGLSESKTAEVLENMPNDEIVDILNELDDAEREKILMNIQAEDAEEIQELLAYSDETVGSIINKDFVTLNLDLTIDETIKLVRETTSEDEVINEIYIVDENERIKGSVQLKDLILNEGSKRIMEIMDENVISVKYDEEINAVVEVATKYHLYQVPVVDKNERLIGVVLIHDIIDECLMK